LKLIFKKISIASDHAGYKLKHQIKKFLLKKNIPILDMGPLKAISVDYPIYAKKVANSIKFKKGEAGILICGSGTGMSMSANKVKGIRAALCYNKKSTYLSRLHNDANIITIGSRLTNKKNALKLIMIFLKTKFEGGRHLRRVKKI
jgi:ribose 5-phosphate isomerase B|tara:strand:+ start:272 stop:709 length:438 start_codon:yes stop_codon:yes gene_type:complete